MASLSRSFRLQLFVAALLASTPVVLRAQASSQAQLTGTVKDQSGGVVPNAQVTVTNLATQVVFAVATNDSGIYRFPDLQPAQYRLSCALPGFKTFEQTPITLQVNQIEEINVTLTPGSTSEQVTVTAQAPPLDTSTATLGQVVTTRSIENLPLNVRDPLALLGLTPGVIFGPNFGNGGGKDVGRNFFKSDFNVGGGRSGSQEILIDGAPDTTPDINRGVIDPPVDSVQEFKVQANSFDAQFGRTSGGVINMVTKSGTNEIHGVAYDFERHSVLDANNFFNNLNHVANPSFQRHQFGGNVGGPILKSKWFFFGDYEGLRQAYPITDLSTVPTPLERQGNFSQTYTSSGQLIQVYDPSTLVTGANNTRTRSVFAGNVVPATRLDPVASAILQYIPLPNTAGNLVTNQNNYIYSANSITNSDKYDIRSDADFNENNRMYVRFSRQEDDRVVPGTYALPAGGGRATLDHYTQAVADYAHVFSPAVVSDIQFSFTRALAAQNGLSQGFNQASLKFPASYVQQVVSQFPAIYLTDTVGTSNPATTTGSVPPPTNDAFTQFQPRNVFATLGSINVQHNRHSLKFGGDWRILDFNEAQSVQAAGAYSFDRTFTQGPNPVQASTAAGFSFASFLLGDPTSGAVTVVNPISTRGLYYGIFVQDDWKATDRLTINFGLRWDVGIGNREKYNRLAYFNPTAPNPLGPPAGLPNLSGELTWLGGGNPQNQQATDWLNLAPRFGIAYSLDSKTVVRGGYGIFFLPRVVQGNGDGAVEAVRTTPMVASINGLTPTNTLSNPFPQGILPALNDRNPLANVGAGIAAPMHGFSNGYTQIWSFGIQREIPGGIVVDAHYWASSSKHLLETWNLNQVPDADLALGSHLNDSVPNPFYGLISTGALSGSTISRQQSLLPYPQYTSVQQVFVPAGNSTYQAGTIQAEKRLSTSLTFLASYTRSKAIDDVRTPLDIYNRRLEKGLSTFDTPNQFRLSGVYNLPFGHGRNFGQNWNRVVNAFLGGWNLNGILTEQSGLPISISRPAVNNGTSARLSSPSIYRWFNTSVFTNAAPYTFGNVGPVLPDVRTDTINNLDAVLVKSFATQIGERLITTQFRSEFYNLFNHPLFAAPNGTVSSQTFGQVTSQANNPRDIQFGLKVSF